MLLALSAVSSRNVCKARVHTDSAAEQVLMQCAVPTWFPLELAIVDFVVYNNLNHKLYSGCYTK